MSRTYHHGWKARERNGLERNWCWNEPKEWRRLFKHKKRRAECRKLQHRVIRGEHEQNWPLDSKPWIYYW